MAKALEDAGCGTLAAIAYAYAYIYTRGRSGWGSFGDEDARHFMESALRIEPGQARRILANELAYRLREQWYSFGVTTKLITQLPEWETNTTHADLWNAAFEIIAKRLPLMPENGWFAQLDPDHTPECSVNEALVAKLILRTDGEGLMNGKSGYR